MADLEDIPREEDDYTTREQQIRINELILTKLVRLIHVKEYCIIGQSKAPRKFKVCTEYRKFNQTTTSYGFITWDVPWEGQNVWKESEVRNLDGSPVFSGYFFTDFEEFNNDSVAGMARLLSEKAKVQIKSKI